MAAFETYNYIRGGEGDWTCTVLWTPNIGMPQKRPLESVENKLSSLSLIKLLKTPYRMYLHANCKYVYFMKLKKSIHFVKLKLSSLRYSKKGKTNMRLMKWTQMKLLLCKKYYTHSMDIFHEVVVNLTNRMISLNENDCLHIRTIRTCTLYTDNICWMYWLFLRKQFNVPIILATLARVYVFKKNGILY